MLTDTQMTPDQRGPGDTDPAPASTMGVMLTLHSYGNDIIIIETVGVGQTELAIMDLADTTVVVTVHEGGDGVQGVDPPFGGVEAA